jgi:hypothetical protein
MEPAEPKPRRKRSGSENRKRSLPPFPVRLDATERAAIEEAADREGVTMGTYIRSRALAVPTTGTRRRAPVDVVALAKLLGTVNKMGGNLHQLVKHLNFGGFPIPEEMCAALQGYEAMVAAVMKAMGQA